MSKHDSSTKPKSTTDKVKEQQGFYDVPERYEIIRGIRYDLKPSPLLDHQEFVLGLSSSLLQTCHASGLVVIAPMDVHLDEQNTVQPDIIFISNENMGIIKGRKIHGAPDLLVEVVSPSSGTHDKIRKKALYEAFGVREYWMADPRLKTVDQFRLIDAKLQLVATYGPDDRLTSPVFPCLDIDLEKVFERLKRFDDEE